MVRTGLILYSLLLFVFVISFLVQIIVIKVSRKKTFCIDYADLDKPQKFHENSVPRAGGLGILIALVVGFSIMNIIEERNEFLYLTLSALPAFIAGFSEDKGSHMSPKLRLSIIGVGAVLAMMLLNSVVYDIGLFRLPVWLALPFTLFCVIGVTNAINIIDGFNGLSSGVSIIALTSFAASSYIYGDQFVFSISIIMIAAILGFSVCNFPKGKIFLGDGGAYLIGFLFALISILLVQRNPEISPWFPVVVLSYPIFETLFSIYRKKIKRGKSAFKPDRVHFHMLIYKRITKNNPKTSVYIWLLVVVFNVIALSFHSNTFYLIVTFISFSIMYLYLYRKIVKFKVRKSSWFYIKKSTMKISKIANEKTTRIL